MFCGTQQTRKISLAKLKSSITAIRFFVLLKTMLPIVTISQRKRKLTAIHRLK